MELRAPQPRTQDHKSKDDNDHRLHIQQLIKPSYLLNKHKPYINSESN